MRAIKATICGREKHGIFPKILALVMIFYARTRIVRWPASGRAIVENTHLLHHLWPQVPFYRLDALHAQLRTILEDRGMRVEGLFERPVLPGPDAHGPARLFRLSLRPNDARPPND